MRQIFLTAALMVIAAVAYAQEPRTAIKPAEPIAAVSHTVTVDSNDGTAPIIYPNPLPKLELGRIARAYRAIHATALKATKVANDDAPIVAEEQEKQ